MNFTNSIAMLFVALFSLFAPIFAGVYEIRDGQVGEVQRGKREHGGHGVTGPVHTYVKTDKHANFKWGVRHHVGHHYAGRK